MTNPDVAGRSPLSALSREALEPIQQGTLRYQWKGVICCKNPFDFAIYSMLIWNLRPGTIIEVGTYHGGSALWLADITRAFGLSTRIVSVDIQKFTAFADPRIEFVQGDTHKLSESLTDEFMNGLPRPLLVIEDSSHQYAGTLACMRFFDRWLRPGEYLLVEDGIADSFFSEGQYNGGPNRAIAEFFSETDGRYVVDAELCDYFGRNVTWNTNGYLKRVT